MSKPKPQPSLSNPDQMRAWLRQHPLSEAERAGRPQSELDRERRIRETNT